MKFNFPAFISSTFNLLRKTLVDKNFQTTPNEVRNNAAKQGIKVAFSESLSSHQN